MKNPVMVDIDKPKPNPRNPRKVFGSSDDMRLVQSVRQKGIMQPLGLWPEWLLGWGWRRWMAAKEAGLREVPAFMLDKPQSEEEYHLLPLVENKTQSPLADTDVLLSLEEYFKVFPNSTQKELAGKACLDLSEVSKLMTIAKSPKVREAFLGGLIPKATAYYVARAEDTEQQNHLLLLAVGGKTRDDIVRASKTSVKACRPSVMAGKATLLLPNAAAITCSGCQFTIETLIETLTEGLEAAKRARREGLDIKTMQAVLRDKAKKEGAHAGKA